MDITNERTSDQFWELINTKTFMVPPILELPGLGPFYVSGHV